MTDGRRVLVGLVVGSLLSAACTGGGDAAERDSAGADQIVDESKPPLTPDGPLLGMVLAGGIDDHGAILDPHLGYSTADRGAKAFVVLSEGVAAGSDLLVAWFALRGPGERDHLFSHAIEVGPGGMAFSEAVAGGGLAPGLYETVAVLGEHQVRTPWVVREAGAGERSEPTPPGGGPTEGVAGRAVVLAQTPDWDLPSAGESEWYAEPGAPTRDAPDAPPDPPPDATCRPTELSARYTVMVEAFLGATSGDCEGATASLTATATGGPYTMSSRAASLSETCRELGSPSRCGGSWYGRAFVCGDLPGGSDMPGAVVRVVGSGSDGDSVSTDVTLEDLGGALQAGVDSTPGAGSQVRPGDTIELQALAMVLEPALGVDTLLLYANEELIDSRGNLSGSDEPIPCDKGRLVAAIPEARYVVPDDPPPIIAICAEGTGFDGTTNENCIEFYTGEAWRGTIELTGDTLHDFCSETSFDARLTLAVGADGGVSGRGSFDHGGTTCEGGGELPAHSGTFDVSGRKSGDTLTFFLTNVDPLVGPRVFVERARVPLGEDDAGEAEVESFGGGVTYHVTLECTTCDG